MYWDTERAKPEWSSELVLRSCSCIWTPSGTLCQDKTHPFFLLQPLSYLLLFSLKLFWPLFIDALCPLPAEPRVIKVQDLYWYLGPLNRRFEWWHNLWHLADGISWEGRKRTNIANSEREVGRVMSQKPARYLIEYSRIDVITWDYQSKYSRLGPKPNWVLQVGTKAKTSTPGKDQSVTLTWWQKLGVTIIFLFSFISSSLSLSMTVLPISKISLGGSR